MANTREKSSYVLFLACTFIFLIFEQSMLVLTFLTAEGIIFGVFGAIIFSFCAFGYLALDGPIRENIVLFSFIASAINLLLMACYVGGFPLPLFKVLGTEYLLTTAMILLPSIPFFIGISLLRNREKMRAHFGYVLVFLAVSLIVVYFASGLVVRNYVVDDETYIAMASVVNLAAHGLNPYTNSLASQLYANSYLGMTITTDNHILGTLNYPSLYMLSNAPFILLAPTKTIYSIEHFVTGVEYAVFLIFLLVVIGLSIKWKKVGIELIGLVLMIGFMLMITASINEILMLALLILAYKEAGHKYSWLLLGLCISMQELLWIPVVLILVYTIRNYGLKKGLYDILGAALVFLALNAYFILIGPGAFFGKIFSTTHGNILPISFSPFGMLILFGYHTLLSLSTASFYLMMLIVVVALFYFNKKRLIGLFSVIPFMFAFRSLESYYSFFAVFIFICLLIEEPKIKQQKMNSTHKIFPLVFACLLIAALVVSIYLAHIGYTNGLNLNVSNQSASYIVGYNSIRYSGTLHYNGGGTAYLMFFGYINSSEIEKIGLLNQSLINGSMACHTGNLTCLVNVNRLVLNPNSNTLEIKAMIPYELADGSNTIKIGIYTGNYFYIGNAVRYT